MGENAPATSSFFPRLKSELSTPRALGAIALSLALGAAGAGIGWIVYVKPMQAIARVRYQSHLGLMRLYDLQMAYRGANGAYANDLDSLLASAADGAQIREKLKGCVDINTLAVIGDENRFRLEANVLDPERTAVKIRGPLGGR